MFVVVTSHGAELTSRPMVPAAGFTASASLAIDLERPHEVGSESQMNRSPLDLLLGVDGSPGRYLDLCVWATGLDWTGRAPEGRVTGAEIVAEAKAALATRFDDLTALASAAQGMLGNGDPIEACVTVRRLTSAVGMGPGLLDGEWAVAVRSDDLIALAAAELLLRASKAQDVLAVCVHCGRPFIPVERRDERYCRRPAPGQPAGGRACRQVGPQVTYGRSHGADLRAAYRKAYKRLDLRSRRGHLSRAALNEWRTKARQLVETGEHRRWTLQRLERELTAIEPREV